jgi:hypothetical protein
MNTRADTYEYRNRFVFNQRGGTFMINNSTNRELVKISHHSGSNIAFTNFTTTELATTNKQTKVINDEFRTVGNHNNLSVGGDNVLRVGENNYEFIGYSAKATGLAEQRQIGVHYRWQSEFKTIAQWNGEFDVMRGGYSFPGGTNTPQTGSRAKNPDLKFKVKALDNTTSEVKPVPIRDSKKNQVWTYTNVANRNQREAVQISPTIDNIKQAFGRYGTYAPGIIKFGASKSSATEGGNWVVNSAKNEKIYNYLINTLYKIDDPEKPDPGDYGDLPAKRLFPLEARMGRYGGDSLTTIRRNKIETIGILINSYPSIRIDEYGRSQPTEIGVSEKRVIKHHDFVPHVEDVSSEENFPGGSYTLTVGNKYNVLVGSGGIQMSTTGGLLVASTTLRAACTQIDLNASHGIILGSPSHIDIYSPKIHFRSRRQILADSSLGVTNNLTVGGGLFVEGELFTNHITAPLEIQQTESTEAWGYLPWKRHCAWAYMDPRTTIGTVRITVYITYPDGRIVPFTYTAGVKGSGAYVKAFGSNQHDTVRLYPHEHHFHNLPLRLTESNKALRNYASREGINYSTYAVQARKMDHRRKTKWKDPGPREDDETPT